MEKGDDFAQTFIASGTYGFIPDHPSAYTQPLYGFFLIPIYWVVDRSWVSVGLAHVAVAVATAWLGYELGRRVVSARVGLVAAVVSTLHPYLVWHDMHMNREILDQVLAPALVLLVVVAAERAALGWAVLAGAVAGVAILGNVRLAALPLLLAAYLLWRRGRGALVAAAALVAVAAVVVSPWVVRNKLSVGCVALTTDARALWKANNVHTLETLRAHKWIDHVPPLPGAPPTPQDAGELYKQTGRVLETDECAQMRLYRREAAEFVREHPGEKVELAAYAARMLWQPAVTKTEDRPGAGTWLDTGRDLVEPAFMIAVYLLAAYGLTLVPRPLAVLVIALLAYQTLFAMLFVGETRYRAPWDFLLVLLAAAAAVQLRHRLLARRRVAPE